MFAHDPEAAAEAAPEIKPEAGHVLAAGSVKRSLGKVS